MSVTIALAGNPNCGKTTMFNALTGANQYVGNWPGVTVEKKEGKLKNQKDVTVTDLPGIYSLSPYTLEEVVSRDYLLKEKPDVIIDLVDATNIERNLYLATQLLEIGIPVVIALNMVDLLKKNNIHINVKGLSSALGCPIVETSALKGTGLKEVVDVDDITVFPLLKSSDIGKGLKGVRKYLILPQTNISENTSVLKERAPKTYSYLLSHATYLDGRKSIIYKNKPRFSVFGLGDYSFAPYKIVISALYSDLMFSLVEPIAGKPVMVDDTCYLLGFEKIEYAKLTLFILQSEPLKRFIQNICFMDAKRIVNRELLMRINLYQLSKTVDYSSIGISQKEIQEYQSWLYMQTTPNLFCNQI